MGYLEKTLSSSIDQMCSLYLRYVDDTYILVPKNFDESLLLDVFNGVSDLRFTCEWERDDSLPFLDVLVTRRSSGQVKTSVYRKGSWTGLYINYHSFVPFVYKVNLIKNLALRAHRLCSSDMIQSELMKIRETLFANGYPAPLLDRYLRQSSPDPVREGPEKKQAFLKVPFVGDKAAAYLKRKISEVLRKYMSVRPVIIFKTRRVPSASLKDPLPEASQVIYKFKCACGCTYIGRTGRSLKMRIAEHVPRWLERPTKCPPRSTRTPNSAVTRHLQVCSVADVRAASSYFSVLYSCADFSLLCTLESMCILRFKPDLCIQKEYVKCLILPW